MEQNTNNTELPQIVEEQGSNSNSNKSFPIFMILGTLAVFMITGLVLFYNSRRNSSATYSPNYTQENEMQARPTAAPQVQTQATISPTPASVEEADVESVNIDDGSSDFSSLNQTASGL